MPKHMQKRNNLYFVRVAGGILAAALLAWGVLQGDVQQVLNKAAHICLECIGIG